MNVCGCRCYSNRPIRSHFVISGIMKWHHFGFCCRKEKVYRNIIMLHIYFLMFHLVYFSMSNEEQRWIKIPCHANIEQGVKYRRITWYKVEESSDVLAGLVSKDLLKNITTLFKFAHHSYEVGEDNSLRVPGTTEEDCGVYRCTLWPPLGHYIQEGNAEYYSADCIKPQVQAVSSKKDTLSANHQFIIVGCVLSLVACAVIMFLNFKMIKKNNIMKKLVQTDESI